MEVPTTAQVRTWAALDVHVSKVRAAVFDVLAGEHRDKRLPGEKRRVADFVADLPRPARLVYEAGPTGFGLARSLNELDGVDCMVCAPGLIPRGATDRVETDRRDARRLARLLMAGELRAVRIPSHEEEALGDLVRAREDVRCELTRARHRLSKLLLRRGPRFEDGANWTQRHHDWLARVELEEVAAAAAFHDYLGAVDALRLRRASLESSLAESVGSSPWAETVARLRCLRGVDTLTALGLCAEVGDFDRFERAKQLMSFVGLVPAEQSTAERRWQRPITKSGSLHARRLLVEAARHYRRRPSVGRELERRQRGQDPEIVALAWKAQRRLHRSWQRLDERRHKRRTVVAVAVALELAGFCSAVATA
jgi:transposase